MCTIFVCCTSIGYFDILATRMYIHYLPISSKYVNENQPLYIPTYE